MKARSSVLVGITIAGLITWMAGASPMGSSSELERDPTGWTDLLAGAGPALKGWSREIHHPGEKLEEKSQWFLDPSSQTLLCEGTGGHDWLRWDRELGDFIFHVEWKFTPLASGKKGYNSGIYVRNSRDAKIWHQAQVGNGPDAYFFGETLDDSGSLKRFNRSREQTDKRVRPAGEWNVVEITARGQDISLWVNGEVVNAWHDCRVPRGYLGLEAEGYRIEFRNLKLKPL